MLVDGTIDAAVRGTISARKTLQQLKEQTGAHQMCRSALLSTSDARQFFLLPVGIDEGTSMSERVHLVVKTAKLLSALSVAPTVGVLSGGRSEDKGRTEAVDLTLASAEALTKRLTALVFIRRTTTSSLKTRQNHRIYSWPQTESPAT